MSIFLQFSQVRIWKNISIFTVRKQSQQIYIFETLYGRVPDVVRSSLPPRRFQKIFARAGTVDTCLKSA